MRPPVWLGEVQRRTDRNNSRGIDVIVRDVVVALDVVEVYGLRDAGLLIKIHQITLKVFIIHDAPHVALEMPVIDHVEANERAEEPPIRLDDTRPEKESARGQARLQFIQRCEQRAARLL